MLQLRTRAFLTNVISRAVVCRKKIFVTGVVQGVGFRPFVFRLAKRHELAGWVRNTSSGVEIDVEGQFDSVEAFVRQLREEPPALARVESVAASEAEPMGGRGFQILDSKATASTQSLAPADVTTCEECFSETTAPGDRRYEYPFTNCTNCGPRFTIIRRVPYDRPNTTMAAFEMCDDCAAEYADPMDRRFHAEPNACPVCGPRVWLEENGRRVDAGALEAAAKLLRKGKVVAVKGMGGFHLACDARNDAAVRELRVRKGRVCKPFALMARDLAEAERLCDLSDHDRRLLLSRERPIVLAKKSPGGGVSDAVAPNNKLLGIMLPYTPLHALLLRISPPALVMTSGNLTEEPLAFTNDGARSKLGKLADAFLMHDREIHVPCDDSVVRPVEGNAVIPVRRARGYVPNAIALPVQSEDILACGADLKNTFCFAWDGTAVLSQHIGDLDGAETYNYYQYAIEHFKALFRREPSVIARDLHPAYMSSQYASRRTGARVIAVQHHHAHIASCLAENGRTDKCIGIALDGAGFGPDGAVWGGEILIADLADFARAGRFAYVRQPGGDAAALDPRRMAAAYLRAAYGDDFEAEAARLGLAFAELEARTIRRQLETGLNSPLTSSAGRLFDAVSAAIGVCRERGYEGQPAIELEMIADEQEDGFYDAPVMAEGEELVLDTVRLFKALLDDHRSGTPLPALSARFHNSVARALASACETVRARTGLTLVALSGGVFQNALLLTRLRKRLEESGFEVLTHSIVPPNDGGVSLGQAAIAARLRQAQGKQG